MIISQKHLDLIHKEKYLNTKNTQAWGWEDKNGIVYR